MILSLAACNSAEEQAPDKSSEVQSSQPPATPPADAAAHDNLLYEADTLLGYARMADDSGVTLQAEYTYGLALAPVSSLRLCVDNILWLKGEGETVEDIIGAAPYSGWDEIIAVGLGSPMPFYFEGLLYQVQGKDTEAADCYKKAEANPSYAESDFYYLKDMGVEDLYALHNLLVERELEILDEYAPRAVLYAERTGAEFSPAYHAALAAENMQEDDNAAAYGCFLNAVMCCPQIPDYYATTILLGMQTGQTDMALYLLNEGLWAFPQNGEINYAAALVAYTNGDMDGARAYLNTAEADTELSAEFAAGCEQLSAQIGGQ